MYTPHSTAQTFIKETKQNKIFFNPEFIKWKKSTA
jgi:hypothetical protein